MSVKLTCYDYIQIFEEHVFPERAPFSKWVSHTFEVEMFRHGVPSEISQDIKEFLCRQIFRTYEAWLHVLPGKTDPSGYNGWDGSVIKEGTLPNGLYFAGGDGTAFDTPCSGFNQMIEKWGWEGYHQKQYVFTPATDTPPNYPWSLPTLLFKRGLPSLPPPKSQAEKDFEVFQFIVVSIAIAAIVVGFAYLGYVALPELVSYLTVGAGAETVGYVGGVAMGGAGLASHIQGKQQPFTAKFQLNPTTTLGFKFGQLDYAQTPPPVANGASQQTRQGEAIYDAWTFTKEWVNGKKRWTHPRYGEFIGEYPPSYYGLSGTRN